jgi:REP element-mobilizing transposase RayT
MGRQQRDLSTSEWQHVFNRGADKQDICSSDGDRLLFEELMAETFEPYDISVHGYALMTNHFHLLTHAPAGGLSEAMQQLCGRYGSAYNQRTARTGSLFTGRFRNVPIMSDAQLAWTGRYIHRNPLAIVPPAALAAYRWSSLGVLLGRRPAPPWLVAGTLLTGWSSPDGYLSYVVEPQPSDRLSQGVLEPLVTTSCGQIDRAVAAVVTATDPSVFGRGLRAEDVARTLCVMLALETRAADPERLAARHGLSSPSSVRRLARRGRVLAAESPWFAALHTAVLNTIHTAPAVRPAA